MVLPSAQHHLRDEIGDGLARELDVDAAQVGAMVEVQLEVLGKAGSAPPGPGTEGVHPTVQWGGRDDKEPEGAKLVR